MDKQRRHFTSEEKVRILRQIFFENGAAAFERQSKTRPSEDQERIAALEQKLKHEVLSEPMEEHVAQAAENDAAGRTAHPCASSRLYTVLALWVAANP
jgi:hypothetical protein